MMNYAMNVSAGQYQVSEIDRYCRYQGILSTRIGIDRYCLVQTANAQNFNILISLLTCAKTCKHPNPHTAVLT